LDSIALDKIQAFEEGLLEYARRNAKSFYKEVTDTKMWTEAGEAELVKVIGEFKTSFSK
jgi:F0F1-type ATP synthase alpha subunit